MRGDFKRSLFAAGRRKFWIAPQHPRPHHGRGMALSRALAGAFARHISKSRKLRGYREHPFALANNSGRSRFVFEKIAAGGNRARHRIPKYQGDSVPASAVGDDAASRKSQHLSPRTNHDATSYRGRKSRSHGSARVLSPAFGPADFLKRTNF